MKQRLPDKPTPSMCEAGIMAMDGFESGMGQIIITGQPREIYEAMVKQFYKDLENELG